MKITAKIISLCLCISLLFCISSCKSKDTSSKAPSEPSDNTYQAVDMTVACLKGPTGVGMVQLMNSSENKTSANNYTFTVASAADEISGKIVSGEINIASVPTNLAAKLYNKTGGNITMLAVNTLGVLSIIENGNSIKSISDLKGKTIYSTGEGSNPEYILRYILSENGLDPDKDVKIKFLAANDELIAYLISGKAEIAMVPEPAATTVLTKKDTLTRVLSINDEWEKVSDSSLMMGCVVALKSYVEEKPEAVKKFLEEYENSINYAKNNLTEAAVLCEKYGIIPSAAIAERAIPECNLTFMSGKDMQNAIGGYFEVLTNADASSIGREPGLLTTVGSASTDGASTNADHTPIGGKLPEDDFYYGIE